MIRFGFRPIRAWVRPAWFIPAMFACCLMLEAPYAWWSWWKQVALGPEILRLRDSMMLILCGVFGVLRANSLHPLAWPSYGSWLARTPWHMPKPLPLGPIHLTPRDGVLLGIVMLLLHDANVSVLRVPLVFLMVYLAAQCGTLATTGCKAHAYAVMFGLGLAVRFWFDPTTALCLAALVYPLAYAGLRRSLYGFPWAKPWLMSISEPEPSLATLDKHLKLDLSVRLGWPFDTIRPKLRTRGISIVDGTMVSLLVGWWLYCMTANPMPQETRSFILGFAVWATFGLTAGRVMLYCQNYRPPINLWGRIFTLRWIIPGYDKVFAAPILAVLLCGPTAAFLGAAWGPDKHIGGACMVAVIVFVLLVGGPTLEEWRHTGNHRIVPTTNAKLLVKL